MTRRLLKPSVLVLGFVFGLAGSWPMTANAHFVWVAKSAETGHVHIYFGEQPEADDAALLDRIAGIRVMSVDGDGRFSELPFEKQTTDAGGWLQCEDSENLNHVDASVVFGVFDRGDSPMLLSYAASYLKFDGQPVKSSGQLMLEVLPVSDAEPGLFFAVRFLGDPAAGSEIVLIDDEGQRQELKTDDAGRFHIDEPGTGRWLIRARYAMDGAGEHHGQSYDRKVYYSTLTMDCVKSADAD